MDRRKLVLHVDLNGTVVVTDPAQRMSFHAALNTYLSGLAWGKTTDDGVWRLVVNSPSYVKPKEYEKDPQIGTYYKHAESQVGEGFRFSNRSELKKHLGQFTDNEVGSPFRPLVERMLGALEWKHELPRDSNVGFVDLLAHLQREEDGRKLHFVIPSFLHLIEHLLQTKRRFSIIFRTYGVDLPDVIRVLNQYFLGNHPNYLRSPDSSDHSVASSYLTKSSPFVQHNDSMSDFLPVGAMERTSNGISIILPNKERIEGDSQIYEYLTSFNGMMGFEGGYKWWAGNNWSASSAKPLWVDLSDTSVQHIFFDDGLKDPDLEGNSIVDLRLRGQGDQAFESVPYVEYKKYIDTFLVKAEMLDSILDIDYFVNKLRLCEENFDKLLVSSSPHRT